MTTMRRAMAVLLAASASVLALAGVATGQDFVRAAWWSRLHQGGVNASAASPSPPPPGGLAVGATPAGATAVAAVHFALGEGETNPILTLVVDPSSSDAAGAVILACLAGAGWSAGSGQEWGTAPPAACDAAHGGASVAGQRSRDGRSWTFPLAAMQLGRVIDVLLVPAATPGTTPPPFQINFAPPTSSSLAVASGASSPSPAPFAPAPFTAASPVVAPPPIPNSFSTFEPVLPESGQQLTATAPILQAASPPRIRTVRDRHTPGWVRLLGALQALVAIGAGWFLIRHPDDEHEGADVRGLGAFVAVRTGEVPAL